MTSSTNARALATPSGGPVICTVPTSRFMSSLHPVEVWMNLIMSPPLPMMAPSRPRHGTASVIDDAPPPGGAPAAVCWW